MGRGIISYTGNVGTMFTNMENVNVWELKVPAPVALPLLSPSSLRLSTAAALRQ